MWTADQQTDEQFMRRALALAMKGRGAVEPNPMVGCVIVKEGLVIGEGFHQRFGAPHAEPNALASCVESPAGATAYVSLEPCCHTGKKTPPCVPELIKAKLSRVVIGCLDPNPSVSGQGAAKLRDAGIAVTVPVLESQAKQLNAPFFALIRDHRPYVTLKWAQSADGKVAGPPPRRLWISNRASQQIVHELRARCDAILVGMNTIVSDDPLLTVRGVEPMRTLHRIVLNGDLNISPSTRVVQSARQTPLLIVCRESAFRQKPERVRELESLGAEIVAMPMDESDQIDLANVLRLLGERQFTHLLVEPGPTLARSFLRQNLADRVWIFQSPNPIGEPTAPSAVRVDYPATGHMIHEGDRLTEYLNPASPAFFALEPSVDFIQCGGSSSTSRSSCASVL